MTTGIFGAFDAPSGRRMGTVYGSRRLGYTAAWRGHGQEWACIDFGADLAAARLFAATGMRGGDHLNTTETP